MDFIVGLIIEFIGSILENAGISLDRSLNTKKIDKNIESLKQYGWFQNLYNNEKYNKLFMTNRKIRRYLQSNSRVRRLIRYKRAKRKFIRLLEKQA